jgi:hypothetical protein
VAEGISEPILEQLFHQAKEQVDYVQRPAEPDENIVVLRRPDNRNPESVKIVT